MYLPNPTRGSSRREAQNGFTLIELLIATAVLLVVSAVVLTLMFQMSTTQASINNRTEMHSSVRSVTEVMQQEISQAGRVTIPGGGETSRWTTLSAAVASGATTMTVASNAGLFVGEILEVQDNTGTIDGLGQETVDVGSIAGTIITLSGGGQFGFAHNFGATVRPSGAFFAGVIPITDATKSNYTNGSDGTHLKMIGDINDDGTLAYVEYDCNPGTSAAPGTLTRLQLDALTGTAAAKALASNKKVLLNNLLANPGGTDCFTYQLQKVLIGATNYWFVLDVSITLTAQTPFQNPNTHQWDEGTKETKALLNVSPRNVFQDWRMASGPGGDSYVQPVPANVTNNLLP